MKVIDMALKAVYFDSINRGVKKTEYRDMSNDYYIKKLVDLSKYPNMTIDEIRNALIKGAKLHWIKYDAILFHNNNRKLLVEIKDIVVYDHHPTFAIKLGKRLDPNSINK